MDKYIWIVQGKYLSDTHDGEEYSSFVNFPGYGLGVFTSKAAAKAKVKEWKASHSSYYGLGICGNDVLVGLKYVKQVIS